MMEFRDSVELRTIGKIQVEILILIVMPIN